LHRRVSRAKHSRRRKSNASRALSLERIRELRGGAAEDPPPRTVAPGTVEVWSRVTLADGLELQIEPGRAGLTPEQVRSLVREVQAAFRRVRGTGNEGVH
jgi:hypothetical protein